MLARKKTVARDSPIYRALEVLEEIDVLDEKYGDLLDGCESVRVKPIEPPAITRWNNQPLSSKYCTT